MLNNLFINSVEKCRQVAGGGFWENIVGLFWLRWTTLAGENKGFLFLGFMKFDEV